MHCQRCGKTIGKDARFCSSCGTPVSTGFHASETGEPILVLKPKFLPLVTAFSILPLQIFFTIWGGGFFGGFSMFAVKALNLPLPTWSTFVFFGCLFFFCYPDRYVFCEEKELRKNRIPILPNKIGLL
jgi:hypothetical protein